MMLSSKYFFLLGLFFLFLAGMAIVTYHQGFAGRLLILVFYIFLAGTLKYLWEVKGK